ncbi:glycosyltransferase family 4 protein [Candidatus Shapirobacteria bacterium]|nr:glycosyltransferase family 4 protein [Candidatus Shapirobacteria bacterium]
MKIVIDARMYGLENAGIGRYLVNLINQIEKIDEENKYLILLREKYYRSLVFKNKNFFKILANYPHYSFQEQIFLPIQLFKLKPNLVHFPHFNIPLFWWGKFVVTIHDLIKKESKGTKTTTRAPFFYWVKYYVHLFLINQAVKKSVKIITPSYYWQKELVKIYSIPKNKIEVTYEGVDENLLNKKNDLNPQKILQKYKIKKPFVVYTGSLYPHKNVERLVGAVKKINQGLNLVVVCARNVFYERFKKAVGKIGAQNFVNLVGFVPDEDLASLYQQAEAFVFPSFWEGFGLPGLEAMATGLPVISSNASCLPEIYGEAALYFNPLDTNDIAEKIAMVVGNKAKQKDLIEKGLVQVKKYSWQKMARETLQVYESYAR